MEKILIRGGRVIDPANSVDSVLDLLIEDGRIADDFVLGFLPEKEDTHCNQ